MPDLLLELLSEEIPARMQARAADDLRRLVTDGLVAQGLLYEGAKAYATPRRLALHVVGLPAKGADVREERRGPRVGAPDAAMTGFLKSAGVTSSGQVRVVADPKKGEVYVATVERPGRPTPHVLSELIPGIVRSFPWPKSMRWGAASSEPGSLRWVRPLQSILCCFGPEGETPEIVPLAVDGLVSGDATRGHRFLAPGAIHARRFDDYVAALEGAKVVLDAERRREIIRHDARDLAFAQGFEVVEDEALLEEVAGLVEWPVVMMGSFDESFLDIPAEAIRATIRANQKCFVLRSGEGGALANRFVLVSNIEASDGGAAIVHGNERVVRARLADAKFFWDTDRKVPLADRLEKLKSIVFHEKLGTQFERVERIAALARELAPAVGADPDAAERAARLAKADLVTEMVGEFPELQGLMGRYYATAQGQPPEVAVAIEEHYKPVGPSDRVPTEPASIAVGLADKLDTLVGFWMIGETPTGSKDPYALRRAALGFIRLVLENELSILVGDLIRYSYLAHLLRLQTENVTVYLKNKNAEHYFSITASYFSENSERYEFDESYKALITVPKDKNAERDTRNLISFSSAVDIYDDIVETIISLRELTDSYLAFQNDRLKVYLRDRGARHDLIDAVLGAGPGLPSPSRGGPSRSEAEDRGGGRPDSTPTVEPGGAPPTPGPSPQGGGEAVASGPAANDDLLLVVRRVEALGRLLASEDGRNLLAATKRAANILRIEERKDGRSYDDMPDLAALVEPEEKGLALALARASAASSEAVAGEDYEGAMRALAELRPAVDAFFQKVTVNAPEPALRENRLKLLAMLRRATQGVADFSRIEG